MQVSEAGGRFTQFSIYFCISGLVLVSATMAVIFAVATLFHPRDSYGGQTAPVKISTSFASWTFLKSAAFLWFVVWCVRLKRWIGPLTEAEQAL